MIIEYKLNLVMLKDYTSKILTFEQYSTLYPYFPYKVYLQSGEKKLFMLGATHTHTVNDPLFEVIVDSFNEITPEVTLVEGALSLNDLKEQERVKFDNVNSLVTEGGEVFFTANYALNNNSKIFCPEPAFVDEVNFCLSNNTKIEDCFLFYICRDIHHILRSNLELTDLALQKEIDFFNSRVSTKFSLEKLKVLHKKALSNKIEKNLNLYEEAIDPANFEAKIFSGKLNEISRLVNNFRDANIFNAIERSLQECDSVFVVYGGTHAVMLEPALRELFWDLARTKR